MSVAELEFLCDAYAGANWSLQFSARCGRLYLTLTPEKANLRILHAASAEAMGAAIHMELLRDANENTPD